MKTTIRLFLFFLILLTFILFTFAYQKTFTGKAIEEKANVTRVIDGDTIEVDIQGAKEKIRLLDINTPEKKQPYHDEAMNFLKSKVEGKQVLLERGKENKDKYGRMLRYVFYNDELINARILQEGLANFYSYQETRYTSKLKNAEQSAREEKIGIWEKSRNPCASCISLKEIENGENKDDCSAGNEWIAFLNQCSQACALNGWTIKDDASHIYAFKEIVLQENQELILYSGQGQNNQTTEQVILFFQNKDKCASVWNDDTDSLFLRDDQGKLVMYEHYE